MRRITLFLMLAILSIAALVIVAVAGYAVLTTTSTTTQHRSDWMGQMWGGMMGGSGAQNAAAPYFGTAFIVSVALAIVGISGIVYFALFPEIRINRTLTQPIQTTGSAPATAVEVPAKTSEAAVSPYESVVKTLSADERKVVEVLNAHKGKYLQKYIRSEAGLSRLQTHRIVARLSERGIVSLEKTGNTNTVLLANWLSNSRSMA